MKTVYGLIGHPLSHSFSADYFNDKFKNLGLKDSIYLVFDRPSLNEIRRLEVNNPVLKGLNVTIPYKQEILPYLDSLDDTAAEIGAVNCVSINGSEWKGYNTDAIAFKTTLNKWLNDVNQTSVKNALIFGSGGSSLAVQWALRKMDINFIVVSRQNNPDQLSYNDINKEVLESIDILINTTPLGMMPNINQMVKLPLEAIQSKHLFYDLIYNPAETVFLKAGLKQGCKVKNGLEMLYEQAEISWSIWNNNKNFHT